MSKRTLRGKVAIAGVGETTYYKHGKSPVSEFKLALQAILAACEDAGIDPRRIDGRRRHRLADRARQPPVPVVGVVLRPAGPRVVHRVLGGGPSQQRAVGAGEYGLDGARPDVASDQDRSVGVTCWAHQVADSTSVTPLSSISLSERISRRTPRRLPGMRT